MRFAAAIPNTLNCCYMIGNLQKVLAAIGPNDRVLDVGGGMQPLLRADAVIDIVPFEQRGRQGGYIGEGEAHFTKGSWVVTDFSDHQRFPFRDKEFDFVFCSHTLEDIADPFWVCMEMQRVGRRGYIETPSREAESTRGIAGKWRINKDYFAGYYHHRWFVEVKDGELVFTAKYPFIHFFKQYQLPKECARNKMHMEFWWSDSFRFKERQLLSVEEALVDLKKFRLGFEMDPHRRQLLERRVDAHIERLQELSFVDKNVARMRHLLGRLTGGRAK